jgi:outer membrane protein
MLRRIYFATLTLLIIFTTAGTGHTFGIEFAAGAWQQSPAGRLGYEALDPDNILDLETDLNYEDETRFFGRVNIDMPIFIPNIYLMATPMEFEGNTSKSFTWEGINFPVNAYSKLTLSHLDVALYYGIPLLEKATLETFNIDIGLNVRIFDLEVVATDSLSGQSVSESYTLPIPMVFLAVQIRPIEAIAIEAEGRGISISGNKAYSLIGRLRWNAVGPLFLAGGYRYDKYDIDEEGVVLDADFSGPFGELGLSF